MDNGYVQLLSERTPQRSAIKSSFITKCLSFESTKKGLSFSDTSNMENFPPSAEPSMSFQNQTLETIPDVSGVFEMDHMGIEPSLGRAGFTFDHKNVSRGEFDTTILLDVDANAFVTDTLFDDFLEFFMSYSSEHEIFNLLMNYEELCSRGYEMISKMFLNKTGTMLNINKVSSILHLLQMERNTWRLLRILFKDRLDTEAVDEGERLMSMLGKMSDQQIVDNLYRTNAYVRQNQLIMDWLERNSDEDSKHTTFDKFEFFTDKCLAQEHTLNELAVSNYSQYQLDRLELDPDAAFRNQNFPLHDIDKENESRLFKFMFQFIRCGKLDEAQQLAKRFGEVWLAAALEGWRLYHDPNYDNELMEGQELLPIAGNKYRDLWKLACWQASEAPTVSEYEQALYGSLCGNLKPVLSVCITWEDYLWAYIRASLDKLIEREIQTLTQQDRLLEDLPNEYFDKILDIEDIFHELEASNSNTVKSSAVSPHIVIQKYVILDDLGGLIEEMYSWLNACNLDGQILRCMAHIILFLRVIGRSTKEELCVPILEAYVQELIKARKVALVAPYTSTLPKEHQIVWYAKFLEGITDTDERQKCLQYADDAGLDVPEITKAVVQNIREKESGKSDFTADLSAVTSREDYEKIHAIDWLIFNPSQRAEAVKQANALMRVFIAQRKVEAAKLLFSKVPQDSVAVIMQLSKAQGLDELSADDDNITREYLCFKTYLEAMDAFSNWFHHSIHGKPKPPPAPSGEHVTFKEKVAHEHEMQQFQNDLDRWQDVVEMLGSTAADCLYNVLLFVNGGWMIDQRTDGALDVHRQLQMSDLRKLCIPHISRLLQDLLLAEEKQKEAIKLADIIVSERYLLYKEFTQDDIKQFMRIALDSSLALLDKNMDPLGY